MRRITPKDLQNMYEPVPQRLMDNVDYVLSSLDDREERTIVKKKISVSFVLAAVLIIVSVTALAVSNSSLFRNMVNSAAPIIPLEGAEEMIKTNLGSVENELVTLSVEEAVYDGQSVMTLVRITPKDIEKYAMLNAFLQGTPDESYRTEIRSVKVPEGTQEMELDGAICEIINEEDEKVLKINGSAVEIPEDLKIAEEMGYPVYVENGIMYYADQFDFAVIGRKDGRSTIDYWVYMSITDKDGKDIASFGEGHDGSYAMNAEEQPDGSVLVWCDQNTFASLSDTVGIKIKSSIVANGEAMDLDDLCFNLSKSDAASRISLIPEVGKLGEKVEIHSAEISFTKLRGNLTVEYSYVPTVENDMGISMHLYDADGNRIIVGSGQTRAIGNNRYCEQVEVQALDHVPETLILEAKAIDGEVLGRCVCRVDVTAD